MKIYFELFWSFFKIGLFTFGGGYAMLPIIQKEVVCKGWATDDEILDYYAIGQVTPGIIAVNVSTFVGYKIKGWLGAILTMAGMITPSLVIISVLATGLSYVWEIEMVQHAFNGVKVVIPALLIPVIFQMMKKSLVDAASYLILIVAFIASFILNASPVFVVLIAAVLGVVWKKMKAGQ